MKSNSYKKYDELAAWDLNKGCRKYINQSTPANRRLKKVLRRQARKKAERGCIMRDAKAGTYNGDTTYCTVNAYGACEYCDQLGVCHINDPMTDCDDFAVFFQGSWDFWLALDDYTDPDELAENASW